MVLGDVGGDEPGTTTPLLFASVLRITKTNAPITATSATAPMPRPTLAPMDSPPPLVADLLLASGTALAELLAALGPTVVVVAVAALLVELREVPVTVAAWLAVVVRKNFACVVFPSSAATRSEIGQPLVWEQALLWQQPMNGGLSDEHVYQSAFEFVQSCDRIPS